MTTTLPLFASGAKVFAVTEDPAVATCGATLGATSLVAFWIARHYCRHVSLHAQAQGGTENSKSSSTMSVRAGVMHAISTCIDGSERGSSFVHVPPLIVGCARQWGLCRRTLLMLLHHVHHPSRPPCSLAHSYCGDEWPLDCGCHPNKSRSGTQPIESEGGRYQ
jgi:hypothetical protein